MSFYLCLLYTVLYAVPVEFVQYLKVSYPGDTQFPKRTHDFYYIFLREGVVGSNSNVSVHIKMILIIISIYVFQMKSSRVMRICQVRWLEYIKDNFFIILNRL